MTPPSTPQATGSATLLEAEVAPARAAGWFAANRFLIVFALLSSLMGVSVGIAQVTASLYALHLRASETMLGLIAAAQSIGVLIVSLPVGAVVDRFGPARPFMIGTLCGSAAYAMIPLRPSLTYLLIGTLFVSFFMPLRFVALNTIFLRQLMTLGESKAGWYRGTHMIGMFLVGPLLGARAVTALGFVGAYRLIALMFVVTVVVSPVVFGRYSGPREVRAGGTRRLGLRALAAQLRELLADRDVRRLVALDCATQATTSYYAFFIVVIAVHVVGLSASQASHLVAAKGITFVLALFFLGGLVARGGPSRAYAASSLILASALVVLGLAHGERLLGLGGLWLGVGLGTIQIANLTRFARVGARAGHGKISGLNSLIGPTGGIIGSMLGSLTGRFLNLQAGFFVLACLLTFLCWPFLVETLTRTRTR